MDGQMKLPADILYVILCSIPRREIHKYAAVNRQFYAMVKRRIDETNYLDDQQIRTFLGGCRLPPVAMDEILKSMTQITKARMAGEIRAVRYAMLELDGHWKLSMESDKKDRLQFSNYIRALGLDPDDYLIANGMLQPDLRIERVAGSTRWWIGAPGDEIGFDEGVWFDELFPDGTQLRSLAASNKEKMLVILRTTTDDGGTRHTIATESYRVVGGKLHVSSHAIKGVGRLSLLERCGRVLRRLCRCRRRGVQEAEVVSATRVYEKVAKTD